MRQSGHAGHAKESRSVMMGDQHFEEGSRREFWKATQWSPREGQKEP